MNNIKNLIRKIKYSRESIGVYAGLKNKIKMEDAIDFYTILIYIYGVLSTLLAVVLTMVILEIIM